MAFSKYGTLDPNGAPILRKQIVTNSVALVVSDSVTLASGFIALGTAGTIVFGHVYGIVKDSGVGLTVSGVAGAAEGSYYGAFTMASDNQTVAKNRAECDISKLTLYSAEVDATIGTTTGSDLAGYRMDLIDEDTLDESTAATTTAQYGTWGLDATNSARAVVNIYESQVFGV